MSYSLGIDAGGTYTDAVLLRDEDNTIIQSNKALTSYPDPLDGIKRSINGLDPECLKNVKVVSVSQHFPQIVYLKVPVFLLP